jgi:hypothetical protein
VKLELGGRPVHSRNLDVEAVFAVDGRWDVRAELVDLRKAGFVPIAGDLQFAGLLHHKQIRARIAPASAQIESIEAAQPRVAFEASALSGGESCRDPVRRIEALAGSELDAGFARRLGDAIGGPRGCSHVLALARLTGSSLARALAQRSGAEAWRPGERVFRRTLAIDGTQTASGAIEIALQLTEVRFAPAPEIARPTQRIARMHEVRAHAAVGVGGSGLRQMGGSELRSLQLQERVRGADALTDERWTDLPEAAALLGAQLTGAVTPRILAAFPSRAAGDPAIDLLLQLTPGLLQCASSTLGEAWPALAARSDSRIVCAGPTDSCYIWRRGGGLHAACEAEARD